ncbi:hypothetical protein V6N13_137342 [Hibiscus sabdariffa]
MGQKREDGCAASLLDLLGVSWTLQQGYFLLKQAQVFVEWNSKHTPRVKNRLKDFLANSEMDRNTFLNFVVTSAIYADSRR